MRAIFLVPTYLLYLVVWRRLKKRHPTGTKRIPYDDWTRYCSSDGLQLGIAFSVCLWLILACAVALIMDVL